MCIFLVSESLSTTTISGLLVSIIQSLHMLKLQSNLILVLLKAGSVRTVVVLFLAVFTQFPANDCNNSVISLFAFNLCQLFTLTGIAHRSLNSFSTILYIIVSYFLMILTW